MHFDQIVFPELEKYKKQLLNLYRSENVENDPGSIDTFFINNACIFPGHHLEIPKIPSDLKFFRVRKDLNILKDDISDPLTFSHPPTYLTKVGRANLPNKPVLYASMSPQVAISECDMITNKLGYLSKWSVVKGASNLTISPQMKDNINKENPMHGYIANYQRHLEERFKSYPYLEHLKHLGKFIADIYCREMYPYKICSWISDKILYKRDVNAILYPSTKAGYMGMNIAFNRFFANKWLRLDNVVEFNFEKIDYKTGSIEYAPLRFGTNVKGKIMWVDFNEEHDNILYGWSSRRHVPGTSIPERNIYSF